MRPDLPIAEQLSAGAAHLVAPLGALDSGLAPRTPLPAAQLHREVELALVLVLGTRASVVPFVAAASADAAMAVWTCDFDTVAFSVQRVRVSVQRSRQHPARKLHLLFSVHRHLHAIGIDPPRAALSVAVYPLSRIHSVLFALLIPLDAESRVAGEHGIHHLDRHGDVAAPRWHLGLVLHRLLEDAAEARRAPGVVAVGQRDDEGGPVARRPRGRVGFGADVARRLGFGAVFGVGGELRGELGGRAGARWSGVFGGTETAG